MTAVPTFREYDIGTKFTIQVLKTREEPLDISTADLLRIGFRRPNGNVVWVDATLNTDGTDGRMHYYTVEGDLTPAGNWEIEGYVRIPGAPGVAGEWSTRRRPFIVEAILGRSPKIESFNTSIEAGIATAADLTV